MRLNRTTFVYAARAVWLVIPLLVAGCPGVIQPGDDTPFADVTSEELEPNGSFAFAANAIFDSQDRAQLEGVVSQTGDIDVFSLGERAAGDRLVFDAKTPGSALDVSIAVFDAEGRLVGENDDLVLASQLDSFLEMTVRHPGSPYYIAVSHSAFAASDQRRGSYRVDVQLTPGTGVPQPVAQRVLLDFDGAQVSNPSLGNFNLPAFDSERIDPMYEGDTELIKGIILETFEQNYERFNVTVFTTDDAALPMEPYSIIFFGGFDARAFGLSENVDLYNVDLCDDAIIFAESFTPDLFRRTPTSEELGLAIGNVASHEAGHLLGLNHTNDDLDLMDDRSPAQSFVADQEFMEAPLSTDIIPVGTQDGVLLLAETVGLIGGSQVVTKAMNALERRASEQEFDHQTIELFDRDQFVKKSTASVLKRER